MGVTGRVVLPGDSDYDATRAVFNSMIDSRPAAIARVRSEADVAAAIRHARDRGLPLAIRAGGHSAPGFGCCDDGIVIDVRELTSTAVDPVAATMRCDSGLTWRQFDAATQAHGLAVTGGRVSSTGVTGLALGSGSGWLERVMGLTPDNLIGGRMVTADGETVEVHEDPALLWALRGGGGNFGVMTELRFALRPLGPVILGGLRIYGFSRAAEILRSYRDVMAAVPAELCGGLSLITAPAAPFIPEELHGRPVIAVMVLWAGDPARGPAGIAPLAALGKPAVDLVGPIPYCQLQQLTDAATPPGQRDYFKGGFMADMPDEAISTIVALGEDLRAPLTQIVCAPLGTTPYAGVGEDHSPIGHRGEAWSFQVLSLWDDPARDEEQKTWTRAASDAMSSYSEMVSYPNFLAADEAGDVSKAYSPAVLTRLRAVKDRYDPGNVFRINHNITPSATAAADNQQQPRPGSPKPAGAAPTTAGSRPS